VDAGTSTGTDTDVNASLGAAIAERLRGYDHADVAVHAFDTLGSTNGWLGAGEGASAVAPALCMTDHQTHGAARRGRRWETLPGNLTFSVLQRLAPPPGGAGALALVTGIAVARTLQDETGVPVRIKWPNDLFVAGTKLGGLLIEARHENGKRLRIVGGIGINLVRDERLAGLGATSLAEHGVAPAHRDALLVSVTAAVLDAWARFEAHGWAAFRSDWTRVDLLHERAVTVLDGPVGTTNTFTGIARGVAEDGSLRIDTTAGPRTVHAGEVSVRAGAMR